MKIDPHMQPIASPDPHAAEKQRMMKVAKQFEGIFVNQLVNAMRKTVVRDGLIPESQGEKIYQSMLDTDYANRIAESGQIGLSKLIYQQLVRGRFGSE